MRIGNRLVCGWAVVVVCGAPGCHRADPLEAVVEDASVAAPPPPTPVDQLAPGELLEGTEKAFALVLPRGVHVQRAFMDLVYASGEPRADDVANYIRARVREGTVTRGATGTVFDSVKVPAEPTRVLHILVGHLPASDACNLVIRDMTPPPPQPVPTSEAERFRAAGLTPSGQFLDPKHIH
jgi:hypothetical protein